ncbi:Uncharacterised protein [Vibrio cholerae]|nr:Uncharacterised protein [Vibrio cholerae]
MISASAFSSKALAQATSVATGIAHSSISFFAVSTRSASYRDLPTL